MLQLHQIPSIRTALAGGVLSDLKPQLEERLQTEGDTKTDTVNSPLDFPTSQTLSFLWGTATSK